MTECVGDLCQAVGGVVCVTRDLSGSVGVGGHLAELIVGVIFFEPCDAGSGNRRRNLGSGLHMCITWNSSLVR